MKDVVKPVHPKLLKRHGYLDHNVQNYQLPRISIFAKQQSASQK